jgi:hypothetical protein
MIASACRDNGTLCGRGIFIFSFGMFQTAPRTSNSFHSACRSSPGRTKVRAISCNAARVVICPSMSSIARRSAPTAFGSVIAAR